MKILFRIVAYGLLSLLVLLTSLKIGAYGWQQFKISSAHRQFAAAHQEVMKLPAGERVVFRARQILDNLKHTRYNHFANVDESIGSYELDCSGLACFILSSVSPEQLRAVTSAWFFYRPQARYFQQTFAAAPVSGELHGWQRVGRLLDARPGDIIAWSNANSRIWENTGHVMMVFDRPVLEDDGSARVRIMDSSSAHADDTRKQGETGIGVGTIWFALDSDGAPVGYRLDRDDEMGANAHISIGRLVDTN